MSVSLAPVDGLEVAGALALGVWGQGRVQCRVARVSALAVGVNAGLLLSVLVVA